MRVRVPLVTIAAALVLAAPSALAQSYPQKAVRIIVPYAAGGNTDITARAIGAKLTDVFAQQVIVDNRPGGATNIGSELAARAAPDGYTLLMGGASNAINMTLFNKPPYDTVRDFAPIILCVKGANVLSVHPSLPAKSLKELIALAKARPGTLNFASSGLGTSNQMAGELMKVMSGIDMVHVPYKGNAPALVPHINSGRLRAIAIGSLKRFEAIPAVPTFDESGLKGYEATTWFGLLAPARTSKEIVARLNGEIGKILTSADIRGRFVNEGLEPIGGTQDAFARFIREETDQYAKVIRTAGIKPL